MTLYLYTHIKPVITLLFRFHSFETKPNHSSYLELVLLRVKNMSLKRNVLAEHILLSILFPSTIATSYLNRTLYFIFIHNIISNYLP